MAAAGDGYFQRLLREVSAAVRASGAERAVSAAFARCTTDDERVTFVLRSPVVRPAFDTTWRRVFSAATADSAAAAPAVSDAEARAERERGNALFRGGRFAEALDAYGRAIMQCRRDTGGVNKAEEDTAATAEAAENGSDWRETLALCYANRSAVWYRLADYDSCLDDIEATVACCGYPDRLMYKLFDRRARCLLAVGGERVDAATAGAAAAAESVRAAREALAHARLGVDDEAAFRRSLDALSRDCEAAAAAMAATALAPPASADIVLRPPLARGPNAACEALSSLVDVSSSGVHGRHVVAREPIDVGEVLLVEEPFACTPSPDCLATHCYACLRRLRAAYPCRRCTDALYCSRRCEANSWAVYHRLECGRVRALVCCGVAMGHLALRAALAGGLVYHCCCVRRGLSLADAAAASMAVGCRNADETTLRRYAEVHRLESHEADRSPADLFWRTLAAVYLARCVAGARLTAEVALLAAGREGRGDGGGGSEDEENEAVGALAAVVLHHLQVFPCNAHEVSELRGMAGSMQCSELVEIGAGIYAALSLFNHSCDPGVTRTFVGGRIAVVRAIRPLAAGEQVFDNYGVVYATHATVERRAKLRQQYYFDCACAACTSDWPLYDALLADPELPQQPCLHRIQLMPALRKKLLQQQALASKSDDATDAVAAAVPAVQPPRCTECGTAQALELQSELRDCLAAICGGGECGSSQAGRIAACIRRLYTLTAKPYKAFNDCEEALKYCFNRAGNCHVLPERTPHAAADRPP